MAATDDITFREAADRNARGALRHFALHADGAVVTETASTLLVASASASAQAGAYHNAAVRLRADVDPLIVLDEMQAFGTEHDRDMVVWTSSHSDGDLEQAALAAGLELRSTIPAWRSTRRPESHLANFEPASN